MESEQLTINTNERLIKEPEAASMLGMTNRALQAWRSRGTGPSYVLISCRAVRYRLKDLTKWIEARTKHSSTK